MMSKIPKPGSGLPPPSKRKPFGFSLNNNTPSDRDSVSSDASSENSRFSRTLSSDRISPSHTPTPPLSGPLSAINKQLSNGAVFRKPSLSKPSSANSSPILVPSERLSLSSPGKPLGTKKNSKISTFSNIPSPSFHSPSEQGGNFPPGSTLLSPKRLSVLKQHPPRPNSPAILSQFQVGDRVSVESMNLSGILRFLGATQFKPGTWAGVELDVEGTGKNDGIVDGVVYFTCPPKTGIFVLGHKLTKIQPDQTNTPMVNTNESVDSVSKDSNRSISKRRGVPPPGPISSTTSPVKRSSLLLLSPVNPVPNVTGARASRYIGMTAAQLKKVNSSPVSKTSPSAEASTLKSKRESARKSLPITQSGDLNATTKLSPSYSVPSPSSSPTSSKGPPTPSRSNSPVHSAVAMPTTEIIEEDMITQEFDSPTSGEYMTLEQANTKIQRLELKIEMLKSENEFFKLSSQQPSQIISPGDLGENAHDIVQTLSQVDELKKDLNDFRNLQDQWETVKMEQSDSIIQLELKVDQYLEEINVLKTERLNSQLESENRIKLETLAISEELTKQLDEKTAQISELQNTIDSMNAKLDEKILAETKLKEHTEIQREGDTANQELIISLQSELENKSIEVGKLTARLDRTKSDFEKDKSQLIETISRIQSEEKERIQTYKEQLATADNTNTDVCALEQKLEEFERIIKDQEEMVSQLRSAGSEAFDHYEGELQALKEENHSLQEQIKNIVDAGTQLESESDSLKLELEKAKTREEELKSETNALQEIVDNYQISNTKRKDEIQKLKAEVARLTENQTEGVEHNTQEKDTLLTELRELQSKFETLQKEREESLKQQESFKLVHASTEEELNQVKAACKEFATSQETWFAEKKELEAEISNIKRLLEEKDLEIARSAVNNSEKVQPTDTIKDLHGMIKEDSSQFESIIEEKNEEIRKLSSELEVLHSQLSAIELSKAHVQPIDEQDIPYEELRSKHDESLTQYNRLQTDYSALMDAQASLLEAHKQMEAECLKLMDEVERLHNESLEGDMIFSTDEVRSDESQLDDVEVNRLRGTLSEKQAIISQMKVQYKDDIRQLQKRLTDLEITKQKEIEMQSKDIAELESIVEHKIFREAELEEQIAELKKRVDHMDTTSQVSSKCEDEPLTERPEKNASNTKFSSLSESLADDLDTELYCELCDSAGHDILSCTAYPIDMNEYNGYESDVGDDSDRAYCDNCEEFDLHWTDECPNQDEVISCAHLLLTLP
ncbi:hypothetical protein K7432_000277 [Basidiobolus ranarum]|uniref:CAP-Gly domain-containing protein n=1 Tax=Basidiobolus ranarum TaxID=34480 RepID=A0ABR2WBH4_9FUNG